MPFNKYYALQLAFALSIALFIICLAVQLTLLFRPLYYFDIQHLNIEEESGLSRATIVENYDYMIQFLLNPLPQTFDLPSLDYSKQGQIHFQDVKRIFVFIDALMLLTAIISVAGLIRNIRYKNFHFLKLAAIALVAFTIVPLVAFAVDFNTAFIVFHEIFFTNDYWIFDPRTDPVITILPETFFLHAALLILGLILLAVIGLTMAYRRLSRKNSAVGRASR